MLLDIMMTSILKTMMEVVLNQQVHRTGHRKKRRRVGSIKSWSAPKMTSYTCNSVSRGTRRPMLAMLETHGTKTLAALGMTTIWVTMDPEKTSSTSGWANLNSI